MANTSYYILMHKDIPVTGLEIDIHSGAALKVYHSAKGEHLPVAAYKSEQELIKWWNRRSTPITQGAIGNVLNAVGISSTQEYLVKNLGLSLSDHYWIKPFDSNLTWPQVNLFTNDFIDDVAELSFPGASNFTKKVCFAEKETFSPGASTQGELAKKWICRDGKRYLIKGNYGPSYQQSLNEVIASELHRLQSRFPYVQYALCDIPSPNGVGIGCICENFASEDVEFIPAYDIIQSMKKRNGSSLYEHFLDCCAEFGLEKAYVVSFLDYQILSDYILSNSDRHFNNFGVLRNGNTGEFLSMAPIFDSGNSLFWDAPHLPVHNDLRNLSAGGFKKTEPQMLELVKNKDSLDLSKLPSEDFLRDILSKDIDSEVKTDDIIKGYQKKIEYLKSSK